MLNQPKAFTVSAITRIIKTTLEESYHNIWVEGEISGYLLHNSGHRYFSLKDERAVLKVTLWRSLGAYLKFEPKNGQKVLVFGDITVYEKGGSYQLNCRKIVPVGIGELELAFRQLHERLSQEGLFDEDRKQEIPLYARKIGVVTSPTGAAVRDIIQIARRRNRAVELIIYPSKVQGDGAERTIAAGIEYFNTRDDIDIIITGRGGGSLEDLWPFNTELAVRAVAASRIPIISAVGHEIDTSLTDLAADLRAPTPSAASELAVWSKREFLDQVRGHVHHEAQILRSMVSGARQRLDSLIGRPVLTRPIELIRQKAQYVDSLTRLLVAAGKNSFVAHKNRLSLLVLKLDTLSPLKILARGYSVARKLPEKAVIRSIKDVSRGDLMETIVNDGSIISQVNNSGEESLS